LAYAGQQAVIGLFTLVGVWRTQLAGHRVQQPVSPDEAQFSRMQSCSLGGFSHQGADKSIGHHGDQQLLLHRCVAFARQVL
jgi:hypothetical protein